ncbi:MAG: dienelactone hydrolase family protein [Tepidisphaeraceae bacterium]
MKMTFATDATMPVRIPIPANASVLDGDLCIPRNSRAIAVFAHGSGSSRHSPRNRFVAGELQQAGLSTLLLDLLTREEEIVDEQTRSLRFDIAMLAQRLSDTTQWLGRHVSTRGLRVGYFGASTGAAAALVAAASNQANIGAIVSRGGRPDLAGDAISLVKAPTLLIVGGDDFEVLSLNREAARQLRAEHRLDIVPGATHLFEEPGTLEQVAHLARDWFVRHLLKG